jgi:lipid II:glycine glycyltransferase (peptidoglycan interpeptide bridge formation enzyme)
VTIVIGNLYDDNRWDNFVFNHQLGTIYHTSAWGKVLKETYHFEPLHFYFKKKNGELSGGAPFFLIKNRLMGKRIIALPFSDYCDPLLDDTEDVVALQRELYEFIEKENIHSIEIRVFKNQLLNGVLKKFHINTQFKTFVLPLNDSIEAIKKKFHKSCIQRPIEKAQKHNVHVRKGGTIEDLKCFYKLVLKTRKRLGVPPQPFAFFKNLWETIPQKNLDLLIADIDHKPIGAMIFLRFKDTCIYKYGASDAGYLQYHPNHMLLWEAIKRAVEDDFKFFDFGRASVHDFGLAEFKKRWGATVCNTPYFYYPEPKGASVITNKSNSYKLMQAFWKHCPTTLSPWLSSCIYKYMT